MRPVCNLDKLPPPTGIDGPVIVDEDGRRAHRLCELIGALAEVALKLNADAQRSAPIIGHLWGKMTLPNPGDAASGGYDLADEYFDGMIPDCIWVHRGTSKRGYATYCPIVRCDVDLRDVYLIEKDTH